MRSNILTDTANAPSSMVTITTPHTMEVLLANAGEHGHWRLLEGPSTRPRLIYSSGLVGSFGERDGGADVAEVT